MIKIVRFFAPILLLSQLHCLNAIAETWKVQELALMAFVRCLAMGDHMNSKEISVFLSQIVKEQNGQFQNVYDALYSGVDKWTYDRVSKLIEDAKGCRIMMTNYAHSEPYTELKQSIIYDHILIGVSYPDDIN